MYFLNGLTTNHFSALDDKLKITKRSDSSPVVAYIMINRGLHDR